MCSKAITSEYGSVQTLKTANLKCLDSYRNRKTHTKTKMEFMVENNLEFHKIHF